MGSRNPRSPSPALPPDARCPACARELRDARAAYRVGDWSIVRCPDCRTGITIPAPDPAWLRRLYDDPSYYESHGIRHGSVLEEHRERARHIRARAPGTRLLEVGSGEGYLLSALRDEGFEVTGCDVSRSAVERARGTFGLPMLHGELPDLGLPEASFDVVLLYHVLEHTPDPASLLATVREVLRPGGLAIVEVPNLDSARMRTPGGRRHILDVPFHQVHFTPAGLRRLLARQGLELRQLTIPFGPPLAPVLRLYERWRDALRPRVDAAHPFEGSGPPPPGTAGEAPIAAGRSGGPGGWKGELLDLARRISSAYKMTAYAERGSAGRSP